MNTIGSFQIYLKHIKMWLKTIKLRPLNKLEEKKLLEYLATLAENYDADVEQFDLLSTLCISCARKVCEMHPDVTTYQSALMEKRILEVMDKKLALNNYDVI